MGRWVPCGAERQRGLWAEWPLLPWGYDRSFWGWHGASREAKTLEEVEAHWLAAAAANTLRASSEAPPTPGPRLSPRVTGITNRLVQPPRTMMRPTLKTRGESFASGEAPVSVRDGARLVTWLWLVRSLLVYKLGDCLRLGSEGTKVMYFCLT